MPRTAAKRAAQTQDSRPPLHLDIICAGDALIVVCCLLLRRPAGGIAFCDLHLSSAQRHIGQQQYETYQQPRRCWLHRLVRGRPLRARRQGALGVFPNQRTVYSSVDFSKLFVENAFPAQQCLRVRAHFAGPAPSAMSSASSWTPGISAEAAGADRVVLHRRRVHARKSIISGESLDVGARADRGADELVNECDKDSGGHATGVACEQGKARISTVVYVDAGVGALFEEVHRFKPRKVAARALH